MEILCGVCHRAGAAWVAVLSAKERIPVHRGCGRDLAAKAPEGRAVNVIPSDELRREWLAQAFWAKLAEAGKGGRNAVPLAEVRPPQRDRRPARVLREAERTAARAEQRRRREEDAVDRVLAALQPAMA